MTRSCCVVALAAALAVAAGPARGEDKIADAARAALENADKIEVMALDPRGGDESKDAFHDYKVLARTTVKDEDARKTLAAAVLKGIAEGEAITKCFEPRHGLRVVSKRKTHDFVICYQCTQIHIYAGDEEPDVVSTTDASRAALDKALKDADAPGK
jgi:hypothetical protein